MNKQRTYFSDRGPPRRSISETFRLHRAFSRVSSALGRSTWLAFAACSHKTDLSQICIFLQRPAIVSEAVLVCPEPNLNTPRKHSIVRAAAQCITEQECVEHGWILVGPACNVHTVTHSIPDVFLLSVLLCFGTYFVAAFFRDLRESNYLTYNVRSTSGVATLHLCLEEHKSPQSHMRRGARLTHTRLVL